ncbi:nitrogenase molybdenum-iron protein [Blautia obeum]|uniref:Nitrogenase molybdenum-iron protein n=1 Tax=Blautia obeum TaxID=40520 RepID=A0A414J8L0_9FIRM|nr:nitrogenase component 1 [Blautia obeum]RHA50834.1 nitrogenase molybdenum-iron protein [Blautia obeum]RHE40826.1 nitrogenase molybdenum-iron protein [Blautia obeum]
MRGLRKYLTPFAPDQSGAVSVLFELGGIVVICDAGGCTGNVCGFDEPRWFEQKSAIFSAGLRDMDAILGRDDRLVAKLADAAEKVDAAFTAVIGTPVPAVIATDYLALRRMTEKKMNLPVLTVDTDGMELYDKGEEKAFLELFKTFAVEKYPVDEHKIGVLGMTPQDVSDLAAADKIRDLFQRKYGQKAVCYCMGDGLEEVKKASSVSKNIVVSPAALATAKYLEKTFRTPYEIYYPLVEDLLPEMDYTGKRILVVHQQVIADSIRKVLLERGAEIVQTASWFMMKKELQADEDVILRDEDAYIELVQNGEFDIIFADECMDRMTPKFDGTFVNTRHFAVSGKLI